MHVELFFHHGCRLYVRPRRFYFILVLFSFVAYLLDVFPYECCGL